MLEDFYSVTDYFGTLWFKCLIVNKDEMLILLLLSSEFFIRTAQKMKFFINCFFSKCDKIRRKLRIWSHLLKKSLMENSIFYVVSPGMSSFHIHLGKSKYY